MRMVLSWSFRRKLLYTGVTLLLAFGVSAYVWSAFFSGAPTCFDGRKNGQEVGVDCGGACARICSPKPLRVLWARAFPTTSSSYTAAAYVQNSNPGAAARRVHYVFQMYDDKNILVAQRDGVIDIPPVQTVPVVATAVSVGNRAISRTQFSIDDTYPIEWVSIDKASVPNLRVSAQELTADATRLTATIENSSYIDASQVLVVAILFDREGVARAASTSRVPVIRKQSTADVVFTWPQKQEGIVRTELTLLPSF